ncbi:Ig domain-containing protein [Butyrivibrio sp. XB500-5]|uniref:Ig-like domain-containing protein n=1 Tax=Butyrivibrio sp. XB500-5 TaxID=2364880 RepID=UPI000EA8A94E|nr:Ig-like domain-containing protein [Butyrivibrio sp. XB500-5]RKM60269.1 Ig domain-containing protein [Butyrivibrio sp. XB500-5]
MKKSISKISILALSFMFSLILFKLPAEAAEPTVINLSDLEEGQALELQEDTILNLDTDKTLSEIKLTDCDLIIEGDGSLTLDGGACYSGIYVFGNCKTTITSGSITSFCDLEGNYEINGGIVNVSCSIRSFEENGFFTMNGGKVSVSGIYYDEKGSTVTINDGILESFGYIKSNDIVISDNEFIQFPWGAVVERHDDGFSWLDSGYYDGTHYQLLKIVPKSEVNLVTGVSLNETSLTLKRYEFFQLFANVTPDNATNKKIVWSSSNKDAVYVDNNGQVFAIKSGTAVITAKTEDGNYEASCEVTVPEGDEGSNLGLKIELINNGNTPSVNISYNGSPIYEQRDYVLRFGSDEETGLSKVAILGMDDYLWIYSDPTLDKDYPASEYSEERLNRTLGLKIELSDYDNGEKPTLKFIYDGSTLNEGTDYFVDYSTNTDDDSSCFVITGLDDYIWNDNH